MSATRSRSRTGQPADARASDALSRESRSRLILATLPALCWTIILLSLDLWTVAPQTVSADQIRRSHAVAIARVIDRGQDRILVERPLRGAAKAGDELRVLNLAAVEGLAEEQSYLFSLKQFGRDYQVTTLEGQKSPPLVYRADPETLERVKSILRSDL